MKTWNVTIQAENEAEASTLINFLSEAFKLAAKLGEPLDHVYADLKGGCGNDLICEQLKK